MFNTDNFYLKRNEIVVIRSSRCGVHNAFVEARGLRIQRQNHGILRK